MLDFKKISELLGKEESQCIPREVTEVPVPEGIEYISQWKEFDLPTGHVIVDKTICGCGFTEYCLTNPHPTVLCSPRKVLLENKEEQHNTPQKDEYGVELPVEFPIYYFKNEKDETATYDTGGLSEEEIQGLSSTSDIDRVKREEHLKYLKTQLFDYISECCIRKVVPKIGVTYDSIPHVLDVIRSMGFNLSEWSIVVDEFQSIFTDAAFKASVELKFVEHLQSVPNVCYLSATPMLERYLGLVDEFKDLPYYKLIWGENRSEVVRIDRRFVDSVISSCCAIINDYKGGKYPIKADTSGNLVESKEVVIFLNSVKAICSIIKKSGLTPEEVNIICAKSEINRKKLEKLNIDMGRGVRTGKSRFNYGKVPRRDEPNKMFTFCTRTTYIGADFYSPCASTVVCSNITVDTLCLDIALDLPQIVGRQRLKENIFRNEVIYLQQAHSKKDSEIPDTVFLSHMDDKLSSTSDLLTAYDIVDGAIKTSLARKYRKDTSNYSTDFVGFNNSGTPVKNEFMVLSEIRAYEISRPEYQETVIVKKECDVNGSLEFSGRVGGESTEVNEFLELFGSEREFTNKMRVLCDFVDTFPELYQNRRPFLVSYIPINYQNYIDILGTKKIRAVGYREVDLRRQIETVRKSDSIEDRLKTLFKVGEKYSLKYIKEKLIELNSDLGVKVCIKASELEKYFVVKKCKISMNDGTREHGYLILKAKD